MSFRPRLLLIAVAIFAVAVVGAGLLGGGFGVVAFGPSSHRARASVRPDMHLVSVFDPFRVPPLQGYGAFRDASASGDVAAMQGVADASRGYLAYMAALAVARRPEIDARTRLTYFRRAMRLRVDDPLARAEDTALALEHGALAEAAGERQEALEAYLAALPDAGAIAAVQRLETDPYKLANAMLNARLYARALSALDGRSAPSIEAPAERALGHQHRALAAYRAWLVEQPGSSAALSGEAWSLYSLDDLDAADAIFRQLGSVNAVYGRALIANRRGDLDRAVSLLEGTGDADWLWLATSLLEARDRYRDALPVYLRLARGTSAYADDAAYRAYILASRLGDTETAATALALVPAESFFGLKLGKTLPVAALVAQARTDAPSDTRSDAAGAAAAVPDIPVVDLAKALWAAHDPDAAVGELVMALRDAQVAPRSAPDAPQPYGATPKERREAIVALAGTLQSMGEFRHSVQAARTILATDESDLRVWRLAYPAAYPAAVDNAAAAADVPADLVWSIMRQESAFSTVAVSRSDAMGLMQVIPSTWNWLAELQGDAEPADPFDPAANIRYGAYYLGWLLRYFDGDVELAISAYNRGQGYIGRLFASDYVAGDKDELYREIDALETREYLQRVSLNLATYRALYPNGDVVRTAAAEP